ncbi:MAG TPA: PQQ-binding-like beta-propeller repeat protein, partial [Gemmataceae bacterium]
MRRLPLLLLAFALPAVPAGAAEPAGNWPQWRGPLACGFVPDGDPPLKWDEKTNVRWKAPLPGRGSSTPAVWGDRVFVLAAEDTGRQARAEDIPKPDPRFDKRPVPPTTYHRFYVLCFDRNTGKELWRRLAREAVPHEGHHESHSYAAYSPVTDGERLYAHFGSHGTYCYSLDGKLLWERDLGRMETRLGWGEGGSPALHGDTLVITFDHEGDSFLTALDAKTGEPRWKKDRDEPSCWATPLIVTHGGTTQVVVNGTGKARGYDLATGEVLW